MSGVPAPLGAAPAGPPILLVDDGMPVPDGLRRQNCAGRDDVRGLVCVRG
jgi:hypothetical protein